MSENKGFFYTLLVPRLFGFTVFPPSVIVERTIRASLSFLPPRLIRTHESAPLSLSSSQRAPNGMGHHGEGGEEGNETLLGCHNAPPPQPPELVERKNITCLEENRQLKSIENEKETGENFTPCSF